MQKNNYLRKTLALVMAFLMIVTMMPVNIFAETFTTKDKSGNPVVNTTDWQLKEENLKGKNYWPLANKQYLREVSRVAEPVKNPMIGYGGYFVRPDGRTVIRLTMRKFDKSSTPVWHNMQMKLEDSFNDMVDWNDTQTGIYKGKSNGSGVGWYHDDLAYTDITSFGDTTITDAGSVNVKEVNIADNNNTGSSASVNDVPINLVLKQGKSINSFTKEPLVQMRMLAKDKLGVACYTDAGTDKGNYSTYTFSSIVPLKHNYEQNLLREIRQSVTTDRAFRGAGSSVAYYKEKGYIEVRHQYNKVPIISNDLYGRRLGYRQTVNKKFFDVLKQKDASGTIAHIFSTSNNGLPTNGRLDANGEPTSTGSVAVLKDNINFLSGSDLGFIQIAANDFYREAEAQEGIKTNFTTNQPLESWMDGIGSLLNFGQGTVVRYYVDTDKVDKLLGGDDGLQYFPFYSAIITDNEGGQYKYTFKLTKDVTLNAGDKIKIDFKTAYGDGWIGNSARSRNREMRLGIRGMGTEIFLGSNFLNVNRGLSYEYTVQNGMAMTLKAGTELYLFGNYPDGGEATLHFKNDPAIYKANYELDKNPIVLDWQATYSAGTVTTTFQKPDVDEIFLGDKNITGRTAYEKAEVNIRKSKADQDVQTIIAKPGDTSNKDDSRIDVVVNNVKTKGYEFDTAKPGNQADGTTPRTFTMPTLERDMPLLFTNTDVDTLAEESRPAVIEQVQAKVNFDLSGVKSKDNKDVIEKIAPLSKEYAIDIETGEANANYKASGFEGANIKVDENNKTVKVKETIDGKEVERTYQNVLNHDGRAYEINNSDAEIAKKELAALKLRQMPDKYDINVPQGKKLLGWTTIKLVDKVVNGSKVTVAEQFNDLKDNNNIIKEVADWQKVDAQTNPETYIFDANSPIDKNRTVYAVYGEGINLILHSNNTADPKDEATITVPLVISDVDKTDKILDAVSSATLNNMKGNLIIKELPQVPVTGEQADMNKITDAKAKLFNIPKNSFIGWTTKRYTNDKDTSEFAAGNNNERIGEITKGLVAYGTKRIPQKTEWLKDLNTVQNKFYIPNGYSVAVRPQDVDKKITEIKKAIEEGKDIHLYANYRPFFDINVVASYKNIDATQGKHGKYVDTVDIAKKKAANIGLLRRTAVTNYGTPTVHQNANYYPLGDEGIKAWDGTEKTLTWKVPGFDELGQRLSYVSVVVPDDKVQAYKNFAVPNWGSLGLKTYLRINNNDGTTTLEPTAPLNLHENAGNPYGDHLAKDQAYNLGLDAYTSATSRKAEIADRQGTDEVTGYTIWNTSTPLDIPKPVFDNVWDTDTEVKLNWGDAEKNANIKKIKLTVANNAEVILEKQNDGTYTGGGLTAKEGTGDNAGKLVIGTLDLTGKDGKNIVAKYVVEKAGQEKEGLPGDVQINKKGTSAPVDRMKQTTNDATGNPVVEFDIPNPILNKPGKGTVYQAQKWDDTNKKWVDVPNAKYTMKDTDKLGETKTISLPPKTPANPSGVANDDIIRIVSKQPGLIESASTQTMDALGNVKGDINDGIANTSVKDKNYVELDMKGPEITNQKAKDEAFRRFIDISAAIKEIPEGRKVTIEVEYTSGDKKKFTSEIKTQEDKQLLIRELNTILRKGVDENNIAPTINIIAVDEFGNKTDKKVDYNQTYQLEVQINQYRAGRKWVKVTADRNNSTVTLRVIKADGSADLTVTAPVATAGEFVKVTFNNYSLKSGDKIEVKGTCQEAGKTYTANPMILDIN